MRKKQVSYVMAAIIITILYFLTEILRLLILISIKMNVRISDLYQFMRKILEKYDWDIQTAYKMMEESRQNQAGQRYRAGAACGTVCISGKILESHELLF